MRIAPPALLCTLTRNKKLMSKPLLIAGCALVVLFARTPRTGAEEKPGEIDTLKIYKDIESIDPLDGSLKANPNGAKKSAGGKAPGSQDQPDGPTVIHATDSEYMEQIHQAVFEHFVVVNNASFNVVCDKLTAFLHHEDAAKAPVKRDAATPAPATPASAQAGAKNAAASGPNTSALDKAIAEGSVEVTQDKVDDSGSTKHSVGHGKKMIYEVATGKVTLYGKPDLQQGDELCVALAESTVMVLHRDGQMEVFGLTKW